MNFTHHPLLAAVSLVSLGALTACNDAKNATAAEGSAATATAIAADSAETATITTAGNATAASVGNGGSPATIPANKRADAAAILARPQVPILCYHQIRDWRAKDSKGAKDYIVPVEQFKAQIKMLADSGYHTILPDQLFAYLTTGAPLPSKPVMLTFDDTDLDQFTVARPTLDKYGFKAVYFIMTVSLGRPNYMSKAQVKQLSDEGNVIGSHTWDHHNVKKYQGQDWVTQIEKPTKQLEEITGKKINYFAYPFGLWNPEAIPELKKRGMDAAFILAEKRDQQDPLYTIRRIIASGYWSPRTLHNSMVQSF
ncbi:peptidoglycan/xylan/chitin deacetylase (PgdA/CDA1 family) [Hymenobacter luteus]|uniref:Peptidoglycan/xylan/chitin deacetylase (PgdA/CDA1 family) n=2 Tax=Hymenobacter TaxID=89966 RepID=A0A7W9WBW7_9BACT|nr:MULTISPECIES: polysaccharide deacetylase family protein [Hymenobacter]MBB4602133.1 peptidoglycan/xylan/chitin deacetylase (PgdA/CDA1 family) [Hymenobacter latericoloratus]MBB6059438.1 peptidoglycan/xylan/chitin deacetylase (PgdA/CDA1 family) [Hymenobacter luteus]